LEEGVSINEEFDEVTGLSRKVVVESRDSAELRPQVLIRDPDTHQVKKLAGTRGEARYMLPVGANITVNDGDSILPGQLIAKIAREAAKNKDITGGLPRVAELFEARKPKEPAVITEIDGWVEFGKDTKGKRKVIVRPDLGEPKEYLIPKGKALAVRQGDRVIAGEALMDVLRIHMTF
jgi:DNA-directed RNA polymerase subunit beta'